jgi:hypothetical protein
VSIDFPPLFPFLSAAVKRRNFSSPYHLQEKVLQEKVRRGTQSRYKVAATVKFWGLLNKG